MREKKQLDFIKNRKIFVIISLAIFGIGLIINLIFGVELDINFKGGTMITYSYEGEIDLNAVQQNIETTLGQEVSITESTDISGETQNFVVTLASDDALSTELQSQMEESLLEEFPDNNLGQLSLNTVNPTIGAKFFAKSLYAIALAGLLVVIYVGFRFRKIGGISAGVFAMAALLHDIIIVYFVFVFFRIPLDDNFVAVVLTILGYSLNDTIIIYDRIRENRRIYGDKMTVDELVNKSINQTLGRTITTAVVTFLAVFTVFIVAYLLGLNSIISFALPMSIGVISGSYSTICLSSPLWAAWQNFKNKKQKEKPKQAKAKKK